MALKFANWFTTFVFGIMVGVFGILTYIKLYHMCFPYPSSNMWWLF